MTKETEIKEIVFQTLQSLGFTPLKPHDVQADMLYLRKVRTGTEELNRLSKRACIAVLIPAFFYLLFDTLKNLFGRI